MTTRPSPLAPEGDPFDQLGHFLAQKNHVLRAEKIQVDQDESHNDQAKNKRCAIGHGGQVPAAFSPGRYGRRRIRTQAYDIGDMY
jgi:hypothetical protein